MTRVVKRVQEPETEAIKWGNRVHKALEDNIKSDTPLEETLSVFQTVLDSVRKIPGEFHAERKFAINRKFEPVDYDDPTAWCRCITDLFIHCGDTAVAMDWKTGKVKNDFEQLKLNALLIFAHYPEIERIKVAYIWLKFKKVTKNEYTRTGPQAATWDKFVMATTFMENSYRNNFWPKRRSGLCRDWCPVHSCEHNGYYAGGK
jgi:hypothetical protein